MGNRERKKIRSEHNDPINFTCGNCNRVVPFKTGYVCTLCGDPEEQIQEDGV